MVEVGASHGYGGASVARVLERSGVSRQSFYRHYSGREDCFRAAYRLAAAEIGGRLREATGRSAAADRPEAAIAALVAAADECPAAARLLFVEALGACAAVRAEHERQLSGIERTIERFLRAPGAPALRAPAAALLGGIAGVLCARILSAPGGGGEEDLAGALAAWVRSYEAAGPFGQGADPDALAAGAGRRGGQRRGGDVRLLPRGRSALPPSLASGARRSRILVATVRMCAARGYQTLRVADIVAEARVPRAAFYAHFAGKQEAFLAAQMLGLRESVAVASAEYVTGACWPERVWLALEALLDYLAAHPDLARLCLLEAPAAGPAAAVRTSENRAAYGIFLAEGYHQRSQAPPPPLGSEATVAAIEALLRRQLLSDRADRLREALPQCAYVALAPFIGPEAAVEAVAERARAAT